MKKRVEPLSGRRLGVRFDRRTGRVNLFSVRYGRAPGAKAGYIKIPVRVKVPSIKEALRQQRHIIDSNVREMKKNRELFDIIGRYNRFLYGLTKKRPVVRGALQLSRTERITLEKEFGMIMKKFRRVRAELKTEFLDMIQKTITQFNQKNWVATNACLVGAKARLGKRNKELDRRNEFTRTREKYFYDRWKQIQEQDKRMVMDSNLVSKALKLVVSKTEYNKNNLTGIIKKLVSLHNYYTSFAKAPGEKKAVTRIRESIRLLVNAREEANESISKRFCWSVLSNLHRVKEDIVNKYAG
ncbi:MAG: hypothetical protein ABIE23_02800 [archaeon]